MISFELKFCFLITLCFKSAVIILIINILKLPCCIRQQPKRSLSHLAGDFMLIPAPTSIVNPLYALIFDVVLIALLGNIVLHRAANFVLGKRISNGFSLSIGYGNKKSKTKTFYIQVFAILLLLELVALFSDYGINAEFEDIFEKLETFSVGHLAEKIPITKIQFSKKFSWPSECYAKDESWGHRVMHTISPRYITKNSSQTFELSMCGGTPLTVSVTNGEYVNLSYDYLSNAPFELCSHFLNLAAEFGYNDTTCEPSSHRLSQYLGTPQNLMKLIHKNTVFYINKYTRNTHSKFMLYDFTVYVQFNMAPGFNIEGLSLREIELISVLSDVTNFDGSEDALLRILFNTRFLGLGGNNNNNEIIEKPKEWRNSSVKIMHFLSLVRTKRRQYTSLNMYIIIPCFSFYTIIMIVSLIIISRNTYKFESRFNDPDWVASFFAVNFKNKENDFAPRSHHDIHVSYSEHGEKELYITEC